MENRKGFAASTTIQSQIIFSTHKNNFPQINSHSPTCSPSQFLLQLFWVDVGARKKRWKQENSWETLAAVQRIDGSSLACRARSEGVRND